VTWRVAADYDTFSVGFCRQTSAESHSRFLKP